jgi:hypothetical protein
MEECPLCSREVDSLVHPDDPWVIDEIQARAPGWSPADGLCATCLRGVENPFRP